MHTPGQERKTQSVWDRWNKAQVTETTEFLKYLHQENILGVWLRVAPRCGVLLKLRSRQEAARAESIRQDRRRQRLQVPGNLQGDVKPFQDLLLG